MMKLFCIVGILMLLVVSSGCMGINAPAIPKIQPINPNIQPVYPPIEVKPAATPSVANITTVATTPPKYVYI